MSQKPKSPLAPQPPPPPPPPLLLDLKVTQTENKCIQSKLGKDELNNCLQRLLSSDAELKSIFYTYNTFLTPQLQEGPKCGLVALSIASSATQSFVGVEDIFRKATALGFTKQGEMFDARYLACLAEEFGFKGKIMEGGLNIHLCCIIKSLLNNELILVPYDADFNHSPCCKRGHKAHWAVISGVVIFQSTDDQNKGDDADVLLDGSEVCNCFDEGKPSDNAPLKFSQALGKILISKSSQENVDNRNEVKEGKVYLIGMQGKSRHLGLWSFREMAESNDNLIDFSTERNSEGYVIPEGGLPEGLKGKFIILDYSKGS